MIDASVLQMLMVLTAWLERREREALAYLIEENRLCDGSWVGGACG